MKHPIRKLLLAIAAAALPFSLCPAQDAKPALQGFECGKIDSPASRAPPGSGIYRLFMRAILGGAGLTCLTESKEIRS